MSDFFNTKILNALAVTLKLADAQMSQKNSWSSRNKGGGNKVCVEFWDVKERIQYSKTHEKQ